VKKYHVVSAKRIGWAKDDVTYEHFFFPMNEYSKEDAIASFTPVQKETLKFNKWYPYTAYEFDGELFYSIEYRGTAAENEI
jgi:hypothetical protein